MSAFLAIDLGTTGCRSIVFDSGLNVLSVEYEEYGLITPKDGWVEQDASLWWELTVRTARKAILKSGLSTEIIRGISVSSQGITVVPVDENLKPISNAISWLDTRASKEAERLKLELGDESVFLHTGKHIDPVYTLPKLMWLREQRRDIFDRCYKLLMPMDYITGRLTGECVTDHSMASGTLMYDIKSRCWSAEILRKYGIPIDKMPKIAWSGETVGNVLPEIAEALGLSEACTVSVGAQDQKCAAFAAGLDNSSITVSLGTACAVTKLWDAPKPEKLKSVGWCDYVNKDAWVTEGVINAAGVSLRWLRDLMYRGEDYSAIDREAEEALKRGSSVMYYPYLCEPGAEGFFAGMRLDSTRGSFAAAVLEGVAFQIRTLLCKMDAYQDADSIVLFGGGAKSTLWSQIIADATGLAVKVPQTGEAAGAGAAILAAKGCGEALPHLKCRRVFYPSERTKEYEDKYRSYCKTEIKLTGGKGDTY